VNDDAGDRIERRIARMASTPLISRSRKSST
jgi:hypothetical protein